MDKLIEYLLEEIKTNLWSIKRWRCLIRTLLLSITILTIGVFLFGVGLLSNSGKDVSIYKDFSIALLPVLSFLFLLEFFMFLIQESAKGKRKELVRQFKTKYNPELFDKIRDEIIGIKGIFRLSGDIPGLKPSLRSLLRFAVALP